jgi:hypothetical protein
MRARTVLGLVLVAPAAIAAATLAVFLGAGLLIAIAGPAPSHTPRPARTYRPTPVTHRHVPGPSAPVAAQPRTAP